MLESLIPNFVTPSDSLYTKTLMLPICFRGGIWYPVSP